MTLGQKLPLRTTPEQDYKIVRKLGWGRNSSVWLAEDLKSVGSKKYEAIKILTVNATSALTYKLYHEHKVYAILKKHIADTHPGRAHCITCTDMVLVQSVHGIHACFVAPAHGSTIGDLLASQPQHRTNLGITKKIIKQTLLGLDCMHSVLGVVHGDMKPESLLVGIDVDDEMLSSYLDAYPATTYPPRTDIALWDEPMITVKSEPLPNFGLEPSLDNLKIIICDYGCSVPTQDITPDTAICGAVQYRAPELTLGHEWSAGIDIWSVGCMTFECLIGKTLFDFDFDFEQGFIAQLAHMDKLVGPFPPEFLTRCEQRGEYFDGDGMSSPKGTNHARVETIEERLKAAAPEMDDADIRAVGAFVRHCVTIDKLRSLRAYTTERVGYFLSR